MTIDGNSWQCKKVERSRDAATTIAESQAELLLHDTNGYNNGARMPTTVATKSQRPPENSGTAIVNIWS